MNWALLRYIEIKNMLLDMASNMKPGDQLPSRTKLCSMLDTTRSTVDKAIKELETEKVLSSKKGSGTCVVGMIDGTKNNVQNWCVIVPNIMDQVYSAMLRGIENIAQENNTNIILCNSDFSNDKQEQYIKRLMISGVSGFIIVPTITFDPWENYRLYENLIKSKIPFIFCNRGVDGIDTPVVKSNDYYGGYIATKYLIERGYRKIAYMGRQRYRTSLDRCQGYLSALMEKGIEIDREIIKIPELGELQDTYKAMQSLLKVDNPPDAVFCFNDATAEGVIRAIKDNNLRVSDDIGVIGYDDTQFCEKSEPKLSSVSYKSLEIGKAAANLLLKAINNQISLTFDYYLFQPSLEIRASCMGKKINL